LGRDRKADIPEKQALNTMLLVNLMQSSGRAELVEETYREHRRRCRGGDDEKMEEEKPEPEDEKPEPEDEKPEPSRPAGMTLGERLRAMQQQ